MVRKLFILLFVGAFFAPQLVFAAELAPEFNPICWRKKECETQRAALARKNIDKLTAEEQDRIGEGFVPGEECSGGTGENEWGKCLPANIAITEIAFGGEKRFLSIGDFIEKNYKTAISIASILASIVIVMAGFQWATSGGNSETISSAKHKISGAIIGLFIAYSSFFILITINPNLVKLRLPQTWLLRRVESLPKFCSAAPNGTKFHQVGNWQNQTSTIDTTQSFDYDLAFERVAIREKALEYTSQNGNCGSRFVSDKSGSLTCFGNVCPTGKVCTNFDLDNLANEKYNCVPGSIFGTIVNSSFLPTGGLSGCVMRAGLGYKGYTYPYIENSGKNKLIKICQAKNGKYFIDVWGGFSIERIVSDDKKQTQNFAFQPAINFPSVETCAGEGTTHVGYGIALLVSKNCSNELIPGNNYHLVGKIGQQLGVISPWPKSDDAIPTEEYINNTKQITKQSLFTPEEVKMGQTIVIDVGSFPQY